MLFLKNTPIDQILSMSEMIETIEDTLKEIALGRGFELPRRRIHHPNRMIFGILPGSVHGAMGAYIQTDLDRKIHHENVMVFSTESGEAADPVPRLFDQRISYRRRRRHRREISGACVTPAASRSWAAPCTPRPNSRRLPPSGN